MIENPLLVLYFLEILGFFGIGALAIARQKSDKHKAFFFFAASLGFWQLLQALALLFYAQTELATTLLTLSVMFSTMMAASVYIFARVYAGKSARLWVVLPALAVGTIALSSENLQTTIITSQSIGIPQLDLPYFIVILVDVILLALSIITFARYYIKTKSKREKAQTRIILVCVAVAGAVLAASSFSTSDFSDTLVAQQIIPATCFVTLCVFLYAMTYRNLFDIHFFVLRAASYATTYVITLFVLTIPLVYGAAYLAGVQLSPIAAGIAAACLLGVVYALQAVRKQLDKLTSPIFFRNIYDVQTFLDEHNHQIISNGQIHPLLEASNAVLNKYIQSDFSAILVSDTSKGITHFVTSKASMNRHKVSEIQSKVENLKRQVILTDELDSSQQAIKESLIDHGIAAIVRLEYTENKSTSYIGAILLGVKKSGDTYGMRDRTTLQIISNELSVALQNALRFEEIQQLNESLRERIAAATAELRQSNSKLKRLDKSKDEFISMASHQLRTPLTSVKGYISMVLDGDVGKITKQQRQVLEQAYDSSQRMVFLIGDFLNVSRLQTGKFVLEPSLVDFTKLVGEEMQQLSDTARIRGITLDYDKPSGTHMSVGDENKLRQVMMNFLDNAIFYSPTGSTVTIQLYKESSNLVFKVNDQGIGVPKDSRSKLFTKFFRAENARQQRPDGTGIGLYMAKKVVLAHGGSVLFESEEGFGSSFGFKLPLKDDLKQFDQQPSSTN